MPPRRSVAFGSAFIGALAALFWIANRASYKGYFSGDDLAAIALMRQVSFNQWLAALVTPIFNPGNFRPTGYMLYRLLDSSAGLNFAPYLATVQILHGIVTLLVFTLARRFGASTWAAVIGALFFTFHMALFGAFWKPMYNFDILCALFVILSTLAWLRTGWLWGLASFVSFWLAYKSKELAVMLPAVLLLIEYQGQRRWLRLALFFAVSLSFGIQAILTNQTGAYHLALTTKTLATTAGFYADHVMLTRIGILALLAILTISRDRWPILAALLFLTPMLILPGRTAAVYLYVPMVFVAMIVASAAERAPKVASAALVIWLAFNFTEMRHLRSDHLAQSKLARKYSEQLLSNKGRLAGYRSFCSDGYPKQIESWGAATLLEWATGNPPLQPEECIGSVSWQPTEERVYVFQGEESSYLDMQTGTRVQAGSGWFAPETGFRWTAPSAWVRLVRPPGARFLEVKVFMPQAQLDDAPVLIRLNVWLDGIELGEKPIPSPGWHTLRWELPAERKSDVIRLTTVPYFHPDRYTGVELGVAVGAIGFR